MLKRIALTIAVAGTLVCVAPVRAQQGKISFDEMMKNMTKCNIDTIKQLLGAGQITAQIIDPSVVRSADNTPVIVAAAGTDCVEGVHQLLNAGAAVTDTDPQGNTPLHLAAAMSTQSMVQMLVEKGADVNAKNQKGETPLMKAQTNNYKGKTEQKDKIIAYLTKKGAK
jgi:ankyrin repeat protein